MDVSQAHAECVTLVTDTCLLFKSSHCLYLLTGVLHGRWTTEMTLRRFSQLEGCVQDIGD